jgi:hypothetical protein
LIGVRTGEKVDSLPMPYRLDDLEKSERIKHLVQGILNIDDELIQDGGLSSENEFLEGQDEMAEENIFSNW